MPELIDLLDQVDEMRDEIVALERDMVRIPTVNTGFMPTGNETELCRYVERWLAEDGVACEVIESAPGRGNLIARLEGASGKAGLMFMSHLDVVPVEEEEKWRFPPFSATVADGAGLRDGERRTARACSPATWSPCASSSGTASRSRTA